MKRLNPNTGLPFRRGDLREDGYIFLTYHKKKIRTSGFYAEQWGSPKSFEHQTKLVNRLSKTYKDKKLQTKTGHIQELLRRAKQRARNKNLPFDLTLEHLLSIASDFCPVFNLALGWCERNITPQQHSPSLDRIDPQKGYVMGNVQWLSNKANMMKQNANQQELKQFAQWVLQSAK